MISPNILAVCAYVQSAVTVHVPFHLGAQLAAFAKLTKVLKKVKIRISDIIFFIKVYFKLILETVSYTSRLYPSLWNPEISSKSHLVVSEVDIHWPVRTIDTPCS